MPRPVPSPVRHAMLQRFRAGEGACDIAAALGLPERTVRDLLARLAQSGESALSPDYNGCGRRRSSDQDRLREEVLKLREQHPRWGAGRLRVELNRLDPKADLPSERTIQRWLSALGEAPAPAGRPAKFEYVRASFPHEVWQVDAGEQKTLASGQKVSWLRFADECSGAILKTFVFSPRPLQSGSPVRCPAAFSPGFDGAGPARPIPHGQRRALGIARRSADAVRTLAFGIGHPTGVEPAPATPIQRGRGTIQSLGEGLGRTGHLPDPTRTPRPRRPGRRHPKRSLSRVAGTHAIGGLSNPRDAAPPLYVFVGETSLGFGIGERVLVALCGPPPRGRFGKDRPLRGQVVCRNPTQTYGRLVAL